MSRTKQDLLCHTRGIGIDMIVTRHSPISGVHPRKHHGTRSVLDTGPSSCFLIPFAVLSNPMLIAIPIVYIDDSQCG